VPSSGDGEIVRARGPHTEPHSETLAQQIFMHRPFLSLPFWDAGVEPCPVDGI
jgi:hypothetical protein